MAEKALKINMKVGHDNLAVTNIVLEYFRLTQSRPYLWQGGRQAREPRRRVFRRTSDWPKANTALPSISHHKAALPSCGGAPVAQHPSSRLVAMTALPSWPAPRDLGYLITLQSKDPPES